MADVLGPGALDDVFAGAEGFEDGERNFGKALGIGLAAGGQERAQGHRVGLRRKGDAETVSNHLDAVPTFGSADDAAEAEGNFGRGGTGPSRRWRRS